MVYTEKRPTHLVNSPLILGNRNNISHSIYVPNNNFLMFLKFSDMLCLAINHQLVIF